MLTLRLRQQRPQATFRNQKFLIILHTYEQAEITGSEVMGHNQPGYIELGKQVPSLSG